MLSYPVNTVSTPDQVVNILQITDLHLSVLRSERHRPASIDCQRSFEAVLAQAMSETIRCDLILVTGDLVNEVHSSTYDFIFETLRATHIPFACIAGNHDVTDEVGVDLPFDQRQLVAQMPDQRLLSQHVIETDHWQLLLINSAIPGKVAGEITLTDIDWLESRLSTCDKPTLIALHHHVVPMRSDWIDEHIAENAGLFWQRMARFDNLLVIISGHTHQEQVRCHHGVTVYNTPSTCYQFKRFEPNFSYDESARPGYRWLQLANNGQVASWVERLDT